MAKRIRLHSQSGLIEMVSIHSENKMSGVPTRLNIASPRLRGKSRRPNWPFPQDWNLRDLSAKGMSRK